MSRLATPRPGAINAAGPTEADAGAQSRAMASCRRTQPHQVAPRLMTHEGWRLIRLVASLVFKLSRPTVDVGWTRRSYTSAACTLGVLSRFLMDSPLSVSL